MNLKYIFSVLLVVCLGFALCSTAIAQSINPAESARTHESSAVKVYDRKAEANAQSGTERKDPFLQDEPLMELEETFLDITDLEGKGWFMQNNSEPIGTTNWFQGNPAVFPAFDGPENAYIGANFNNSGSPGNISNWLLTPEMVLQNGTEMFFWTRGASGPWPDRLEIRLSTEGSSTDVGGSWDSVGDFTTLLLSINPDLDEGGYPEDWMEFAVIVTGLDEEPISGRFAFRYFVEDSGPTGANSNYIGIDLVEVENPPLPSAPEDTPLTFALKQNYPNPFNPSTVIDFSLPHDSHVLLTVYDILGREVARLIDGDINAGVHSVNFDASNLTSGIYFYRIQAGEEVRTNRMTLVK